jgi:hypothetical protein
MFAMIELLPACCLRCRADPWKCTECVVNSPQLQMITTLARPSRAVLDAIGKIDARAVFVGDFFDHRQPQARALDLVVT